VTAAGAAGLGAKVALVERHLMGGDCLNVGCVPSKAVIRSSRVLAEMRRAQSLGIEGAAPTADFAVVMERMRRTRANISPNDSLQRFRSLGVDVFLGQGRFTGPDTVEVEGAPLHFAKAVIATGARAAAPPIEGLEAPGRSDASSHRPFAAWARRSSPSTSCRRSSVARTRTPPRSSRPCCGAKACAWSSAPRSSVSSG
jgi:pyruvate/2-oxoglutarate dehydrogenase complex dihydrolipoamide dehydrogenase (E3) component